MEKPAFYITYKKEVLMITRMMYFSRIDVTNSNVSITFDNEKSTSSYTFHLDLQSIGFDLLNNSNQLNHRSIQ